MKKARAMEWVAALRSGDYKQGDGLLRQGNSFCCLGVACNLHAQAHPDIAATQKVKSRYLDKTEYLPEAVQDWMGLWTHTGRRRDHKPIEISGGPFYDLSVANDEGSTFAEIADYIEKNYKHL